MHKSILKIICLIAFFIAIPGKGHAVEPDMSDYTAYPVFLTASVKPNILIILDNSGSMNFAAYGTWPGDGGTITDAAYTGTTPYCGTQDIQVIQSLDDIEEDSNKTMYNNSDLDLGGFSVGASDVLVGVRFQNIDVPSGVTITNAYIQFTPFDNYDENEGTLALTIHAQKNDDTSQFSTSSGNLSSRPNSGASVIWNESAGWDTTVSGTTSQTPDLSSIVQEIIDRSGWAAGNSMVFKFSGQAGRETYSYNGSSSRAPILHIEWEPENCTSYYGYFNPNSQYTYQNNRFEMDANGEWNGNWLNWLSMRRIDAARKVLVGGLATPRTGGGNVTLHGDDHNQQSSRTWKREFDSSQSGVSLSPYNGNYWFGMKSGYIYVDDDSNPFSGQIARFNIKVKKDSTEEPDDFDEDGNISGVLQKVADKARFGLEFFNSSEGGKIQVAVKSGNITNMITNIENKKANTWTPLAEAFYEGVRYFRQLSPAYFNGDFSVNNQFDPYYWQDEGDFIPCSKSFILLITDGESTQDRNIPSSLRDYDNDGNDPGSYSSSGSDYLDDVALWAHTNDLRADLAGTQDITLYPVFAFGAGSQLLRDAAKNGGFEDKNGNDIPDQASEWDADGDGIPDNYYEAPDGFVLEQKLLVAITDILQRAAAGTAVSVLATSGEGEGNLVQAYFRPSITSGVTDVKWVGFLQSLWVDPFGNLREDTDGDLTLDIEQDKVIDYFFDSATGDAKIKRFTVSSASPYPAPTNTFETLDLDEISPLWEAGDRLAQKSADDRKIFTYLDKDKDGQVDESTEDPFDNQGEVIVFDSANIDDIQPYLGVKNHTSWKYLGATHDDRAANLLEYIRGKETGFSGTTTMEVRSRIIDGNVWKLGDIVQSTPVSIAKPVENYHIIYGDESYLDFISGVSNRETAVYVGANDGMIHAFTSWNFSSGTTAAYTKPAAAPGDENIGDELWAYIPSTLLPHLKWLPATDYTHVYYADLQPKITDAKILADDTHYVDTDSEDNWGTILLAGLNMGGKYIWAEGDYDDGSGVTVSETRDFYPSYTLMDITDPRNPRLLWERTYQGIGLTTSMPAIVRVKDKWFAVFGSGPTDYEGTSTQKAHVFVVDLKTGDAYPHASFASGTTNAWLFESNESASFMNSPVSLDKNLNNNVDAVYFGETYKQGSNWKGKAYKIFIEWDWVDLSTYIDNPIHGTNPWTFNTLFDSSEPITAKMNLSADIFDNVWVYFGTGRYIGNDDKTTTDTQYLYGIVDPFFNTFYKAANGNYYRNYSSTLELDINDLFDADPYVITTSGDVFVGSTFFGTFDDLLDDARDKDGWFRTLTTSKERSVTQMSILGGIAFAPTFVPNEDICGFSGDSFLYSLYFETGTPFTESVFETDVEVITIAGDVYEKVTGKIDLGQGKSSGLGFHVGSEEGAKAFIQQSTGEVLEVDTNPAFEIKSGLINWKEK